MADISLLRAASFWNNLATSSGLHHWVALDAVRLTVGGLRSGYVAGLVAALQDVGYDMVLTAGSLPEVDITQLRHKVRTNRDAVWQQLHVSPHSAPSANARLCTYARWFRLFNVQSSILRLPVLHAAMRQLLVLRTGCHRFPVDLGRGSGVARADRAYITCMLCGRCPGDELHLVLECAALQGLRGDMPTLFQDVHSMRCFMWQEDTVLMSKFVQGAMKTVRAASSGDDI